MARKPFTDDQRNQRREEILDASMTLFESDGMSAVSFRKVADILGCSYTALYRYFPSKNDLVTALRARAYLWIRDAMRQAISSEDPAEQQLNSLARGYIQAGLDRPQRYALMFFNLDDSDTATHSLELQTAKHSALDICTQTIAAGQASGDLPTTVDPLTAAHMFWIGAHGLVSLQVSGQFVMGRDVQTLIPTMIGLLRAGLEQPQDSAPSLGWAVNN